MAAAVFFCCDIVKTRPERWPNIRRETWLCLIAGSKLMVANIASMLILGVLRFGIERVWGVITFGKVSLLLSALSFLFFLYLSMRFQRFCCRHCAAKAISDFERCISRYAVAYLGFYCCLSPLFGRRRKLLSDGCRLTLMHWIYCRWYSPCVCMNVR